MADQPRESASGPHQAAKSGRRRRRRRGRGGKGAAQFAQSPRHAHYGALDLGTNNCRLLVAAPTHDSFRVVDAFSRIVRLGEGLSRTGELSEAAQDRAIGLAVLALLIAASLPWSLRLIADPQGRAALLLTDAAAIAGGIGFLVLGFLRWRWLARWQIVQHAQACSEIAGRLIVSRIHGPSLVVLSLLVNVLNAVIAWAVIRSIGADVSFAQLFLLIPPVMLVTTMPISIAGWGVREATMALAFGYAALRPEDGVAASLLFGIVNFVAGALGGLAWILSPKPANTDGLGVDDLVGELPDRSR